MRGARTVALCARQEIVLAMRSRWVQISTLVFAALAIAVAASGYILSGGHGIQDYARTSVSLAQAVLLLVPVMALVSGVLSLSPERGNADLLFAQPVSRATVLLGQALGLWAALCTAEALGFGAAGLVVFAGSGPEGVGDFGLLVGAGFVLTAVFLAIAAAIAAGSCGRRARALVIALVTWFAAVVLFDVATLGVASLLPSGTASRVIIVAALANPVDAVRTGLLLWMLGTGAFGPASLALLRFTGGVASAIALVVVSITLWTVLPSVLAAWRMERADL